MADNDSASQLQSYVVDEQPVNGTPARIGSNGSFSQKYDEARRKRPWETDEPDPQCCALKDVGKGISRDLRRRLPLYWDDWREGLRVGLLIFAPASYIFFASVMPAIAFGEQLREETDGAFSIPHVLTSTAIAGVFQAILGGQPLLIVGVAEPIVLTYHFMYEYAKDRDDLQGLYRPFCSWTLIWTALMHFLLAFTNASEYIKRFTRFAGETFGIMIAMLFTQAAIKGLKIEYEEPVDASPGLRLTNGLWSTVLALFLIRAAFFFHGLSGSRFLNHRVRTIVSNYGATVAVVVTTVLSYAVESNESAQDAGVPARIEMEQVYHSSVTGVYSTSEKLSDVPASQIAAALVPAMVITVLFFFDNNVSAKLAQVDEFGLQKPPAYHYDFFLLGVQMLVLGLLGLPPANAVLPQAPMHTRSLMGVGERQDQGRRPGTPGKVLEQRMSNLIQSLLVALCLFIAPVLRIVPRAVLWGYFIFMSLESLPGNQFFHRVSLLFTDPKRRAGVRAGDETPIYVETVPYPVIVKYTVLQLVALAIVYGVTWAGVAGVSFPLFIMALVPLRQYVLPRFFDADHLADLDSSHDIEEVLEHDRDVQESPTPSQRMYPRHEIPESTFQAQHQHISSMI
eukprot:m.19750 g.19750  ORF g.19750 m.19750 type:complete len:623 (-) comp6007_c0_seq1:53-1921(-)